MQLPFDDHIPAGLQATLNQHAAAHIAETSSLEQHGSPVELHQQKHGIQIFLEKQIQRQLRPQINLFGRLFSAYTSFGFMGIVLAVSIAYGLTIARGLSIWVITALLLLTLVLSVLNIALTTWLTGKDSLVFLRYFLSIMAGAAILLRMLNQPVLLYLENLMLGIGALQGIGRIGCLKVGCCYGKPAPFGIRYSASYARAGFPAFLVGARLFPIQLLESTWILISAAISITLALVSGEIGYGLATHLVLFSTGRFCLELLRGDTARTYWGIFSEAQWLSLLMVTGVVVFELLQMLPFHYWHMVLATLLLIFALFVAYAQTRPSFVLHKPETIHQLSKSLVLLEKSRIQGLSGNHAVHLRKISTDLQISDGIYSDEGKHVHHYTMSYKNRFMSMKDARRIAKLIQSWHPREEKSKLIHHYQNAFHFLRYL